jgi:ATP/maltotriose-dependent transcriptional regulator MalT
VGDWTVPSAEAVGSWQETYDLLSGEDRQGELRGEDLDRLAASAYLVGREEESVKAWARAYAEHAARGDAPRAARSAFWLAFTLMNRGEHARAGGWFARVQRILAEPGGDCPERGYLLGMAGMERMAQGDPSEALALFRRSAEISRRFGDIDGLTLSRLGEGQALLALGRPDEGCALLDEAMLAVTSDEPSPIVTGFVYCAVIALCQQIFDLRRAAEWTRALSEWCASHPDLVPYRGQCLVHRSELFQLQGAWGDAMKEARLACDRLSAPAGPPALGAALYQRGELHRLRGELAEAEEAYRQANAHGREPQPGLALLLLAQGRVDVALPAIRRAADQSSDPGTRARLRAAHVEIALAAGAPADAHAAADDLRALTGQLGSPYIHAVSDLANGGVFLADGDAQAACRTLSKALAGLNHLNARYEAARAQVLLGLAYRHFGDLATGELELQTARRTLQDLGADPDVARVDELLGSSAAGGSGLTPRELQVLRLIAEGKTNDEIASALVVSRHTVRRHVQNIFAKVGVSSRSGATAYAFRHRLA